MQRGRVVITSDIFCIVVEIFHRLEESICLIFVQDFSEAFQRKEMFRRETKSYSGVLKRYVRCVATL